MNYTSDKCQVLGIEWEGGCRLGQAAPTRGWTLGSDPCTFLPRASHVCDLIRGDSKFVEAWWTAEYVKLLADIATDKALTPSKRTVEVFVESLGHMVPVKAVDVLCNKLPEGLFGKNGAMHWVKMAGAREMVRRSQRGAVVHDAIQGFAGCGVRIREADLQDYVSTLIARRGFTIEADYAVEQVRFVLRWLDRHLGEVVWSSCPVFNMKYRYAGTVDLDCKLRNMPNSWNANWVVQIDAKTGKTPHKSQRYEAAACYFSPLVGSRSTAKLQERVRPDKAANLHVQPSGCSLKLWAGMDRAFVQFVRLLTVWYDLQKGESPKAIRLKAPPIPGPRAAEAMSLSSEALAARPRVSGPRSKGSDSFQSNSVDTEVPG